MKRRAFLSVDQKKAEIVKQWKLADKAMHSGCTISKETVALRRSGSATRKILYQKSKQGSNYIILKPGNSDYVDSLISGYTG